MRRIAMFLGLVAASVISVGAASADEIKLDVNSIVIDAGGAFNGLTHSGTLQLSMDVDSELFGMQINNGVNLISAMSLSSFTGAINLSNGVVTGGSFTILVGADSYTAMIVPSSGSVNTQAGQGFTIDGLSSMGIFSGPSFAGVDVSQWFNAQPLQGTFINLFYNPDANGRSNTTDMDIVAVVTVIPVPAAAGIGLVGLAGVAVRRRRAMA